MLLALAATIWIGSASSPGTPAEDQSPSAASLVVKRVHWPVLIEPRPRGGAEAPRICAGLGPESIEILEGGEPCRVSHVGSRPLPRVHALLLDTSQSMRGQLADAEAAAIAFVESLGPNDPAMVVQFDESATLASPLTTDRARLREAIEKVEVGSGTALWDTLDDVIGYLEDRRAEKVIVVISDGDDSMSLERDSFDRILERARGTPDLVIFPIGLDLATAARRGRFSAASRLRQLARTTGGTYHEIRGASRLGRVLGSIREQLKIRRYVSYAPPETGSRPSRRVRVRARPGLPCRVSNLGPELRPERTDSTSIRRLTELDDAGAFLGEPSCDPASVELDAVDGYEMTSPGTARLFLAESRDLLFGTTRDLLVERGPLFHWKAPTRPGRFRIVPDGRPTFVQRGFLVRVPPLAELRQRFGSPADLLERLLEFAACAPCPSPDRPHPRADLFVHGRTFLKLRPLLGWALFEGRSDYREWALEKIADDAETLAAEFGETFDTPDPGRHEALVKNLIARETELAAPRGARHLVEWLGDLQARDAVTGLELRAIDGLLLGHDDAFRRAGSLADGWERLHGWFGPATSARILALLIPAYEPDTDRIGFYRFVLPRPRLDGRPPKTIQDRPWGLRLVRWLATRLDDFPGALAGAHAASLEYASIPPRRASQLSCAYRREWPAGSDPRRIVEVSLELEPPGEGLASLRLRALYPRPGGPAAPEQRIEEPVCVAVEAVGPEGSGSWIAPLSRALGTLEIR